MSDPGAVERKLAAILAADVAGYTRLMCEDEVGTLKSLAAHRQTMDGLIAKRGGRVANTAGDSVLAEFPSVVEAVQCALEVQNAAAALNADVPVERQLWFRVGVHLGDVIAERGDLFGDGVNIAARLQQTAEPGSVVISRPVRDQIRDRTGYVVTDLGELHAKNVARPVRHFRVELGTNTRKQSITPVRRRVQLPIAVAAAAGAAVLFLLVKPWESAQRPQGASLTPENSSPSYPLPDKPSLAVLPFRNLSDDPTQNYLGEALAETLISALSNVSGLFVVSQSSSFEMKDTRADVQAIGAKLGVRHLVDGSVQRSGDRVRVTARLVDTTTGRTVWTERYEPRSSDFIQLQDEIAIQVINELRVRLTDGEQARVASSRSKSLEAVELAHKAQAHMRRTTKQDNEKAKELAEAALKSDPADDLPHILLAWTHWFDIIHQWSSDAAISMQKVHAYLQRAEEVRGADDIQVVYLRAALAMAERRVEEAVALGRRVVELAPSYADGRGFLGFALIASGQYDEAAGQLQQAMQLSPIYPPWYLRQLGIARRLSGRLEEARAIFEQVLQRTPEDGRARLDLAITLSQLGDEKAAREAVAEYLRRDPANSVRRSLDTSFLFTREDIRKLTGLGLPSAQ